jgi:glycerate dehydrogenase
MSERIVFLDRSALTLKLRAPEFPHIWREFADTPNELIVDRLREATIAITNRVPLRAGSLSSLPGLRLIAVAATGYDVIDLEACERLGICVSNVRDWCTTAVLEHVFAMILALRRNLIAIHGEIRSGAWQRSPTSIIPTQPSPLDLAGSTIGLIGHGTLGGRIAAISRSFGMQVLIAERKGAAATRSGREPFESVLRQSDIVSLHCPLTEETRGLIGARELALMRPTALLINCARGGVVDDHALAEALVKGRIAGAGLDVLSNEPPRDGNPLLDLQIPNLIITPHTAWVSKSALAVFGEQLIRNLECFVSGRPQNVVTSHGSGPV